MRTLQQILDSFYNKGRVYDAEEESYFRLRAMADFEVFFKDVIGLAIGDYHRQIFNLLKNQRVCIMSPRGHAKTEICAVAYVIWKAMHNPDYNIAIISATEIQSQDIIRRIKNHLETNEYLAPLKPGSAMRTYYWSRQELQLTNRTRIVSKPFTDAVRGQRLDLCICDDILRSELTDQESTKRKFFEIIEPAVDSKHSQLIVVGTPETDFDLLHHLSDPSTGYVFKRFQCCEDKGTYLKNVLFPERWTTGMLRQKKATVGITSWLKEYMCIPMRSGELLFPESLVRACVKPDIPELMQAREGGEYWLGIDVALSPERLADYSAYAVLEKLQGDEKYRLVRLERPQKGTQTKDQFERIREMHKQFNFRTIMIENKGNSMSLVEDLQRDSFTSPVAKAFVTTNKERDRIIIKLQTLMSNASFEMYPNKIMQDELMSMGIQAKFYDGRSEERIDSLSGKDDTVIALALAVEAATSPRGQLGAMWV